MLETLIKGVARRCAGAFRRFAPPLALAALAAVPAAAETAPRRLDIADYRAYLDQDHPARQGMRRFAELVGARTSGALLVRVRDDALPGAPAAQLAALRQGADGAPALMLVAATGLAPLAPGFALLDLPWLVRDEREADALLDGGFGQALLASLEQGGLAGLAWWENGFRQMSSSGAPIRHADDLRGLPFRVVGEPVFVDTMRALGAEPLALPFGALHEALRSGRARAQDNFLSQILAGRLYEVQSSLSITNHSYGALVLVANPRIWATLDPAQRRVLREAAVEAGSFQRQAARAAERQARADLAARGMTVVTPDAAQLAAMRARTQALRERWLSRYAALGALHAAVPGAVTDAVTGAVTDAAPGTESTIKQETHQ